jgi:hypothetical protein
VFLIDGILSYTLRITKPVEKEKHTRYLMTLQHRFNNTVCLTDGDELVSQRSA